MFGLGMLNSLSWSHAATVLQNRMDKSIRGRITVLRYIAGAIVGTIAMSFLSQAESNGLSNALGVAGLITLMGCIVPAIGWMLHTVEQTKVSDPQ